MILVDEVENKTFLKKLLEGIYEDFKRKDLVISYTR